MASEKQGPTAVVYGSPTTPTKTPYKRLISFVLLLLVLALILSATSLGLVVGLKASTTSLQASSSQISHDLSTMHLSANGTISAQPTSDSVELACKGPGYCCCPTGCASGWPSKLRRDLFAEHIAARTAEPISCKGPGYCCCPTGCASGCPKKIRRELFAEAEFDLMGERSSVEELEVRSAEPTSCKGPGYCCCVTGCSSPCSFRVRRELAALGVPL